MIPSQNIWEEEFDDKFKGWKNKKFDWNTGKIENIKDSKSKMLVASRNDIKAFFHQKFKEVFEEVERKSFKDENYTGFRIIGDETFKEIKEKYLN